MIRQWLKRIRARGNASQQLTAAEQIKRNVDEALREAPVIPEPEPVRSGLTQPEAFYASLRSTALRHRETEQVAGTNAILSGMAGMPISWVAYALATAWHETGAKMQPNVENLNYSVQGLLNTFSRRRISRADAERVGRAGGRPADQRAIGNIIYGGAWGRDNLGNTEPNDGFTYRGRGFEHVTGRRNYDRTGQALGLDLLSNPDLLLDLDTAVRSLVTGMKSGRYTGRGFVHFLPSAGPATVTEFHEARRIINGTDKADLIAGYALDFQRALTAGGWS